MSERQDRLTKALTALAEHGIPSDFQEVLLRGDGRGSIPGGGLQKALEAAEGLTWRCFHCDEVFYTRQSALDHFGYDELELPGCIQILTETERAIVEDRREWRERAHQAESHNEQLHGELSLVGHAFREMGKAKDRYEAVQNYLSQGGQLLATQAILGHLIRSYLALEISDDIDRAAEFRHIWKQYDPLLIDPAEYLKSMGFKE